ncbi:histidine kinase [Flavitalea sp. BT771]|uniref:tetratricopeptide repeat-containing sensor histidine kinase n=1 Tax=Flavitalea sp. BT771 TaxID=3063329 RepID=UPI0026E334F6|nr:ATP-binding protein [Flavitalea sp. BT771]MDO6430259.1 histidine kinase [Flavitalea sp. BT771]MDV6219601.1 histidine kinase [Flavitalea sp. BT771]
MKPLRILNLLLIFALALNRPVSAQQPLADSIEKLLRTPLPDSMRLKDMIRLAMYYEQVDAGKAHEKYAEARQLADKKGLPFYKGLSYSYENILYSVHGQYQQVQDNLDKAYAIFSRLPEGAVAKELAGVYCDYGNLYKNRNDTRKAAEYYFKSVALGEKYGIKKSLLATYLNLSALFQNLGQLPDQKVYVDRALSLAKELNKPKYLFQGFLFKGHYYSETAEYADALRYLDSAGQYFSENWEFNERQTYFMTKASTYQGLRRYDSAIHYFKISYDRASRGNSPWNITQALVKLGYVYLLEKKYRPGEQYLDKALEAALKDSIVLFEKEAYESLARLYSETGRYKDAYQYYKTFHALTDSLVGTEKKKFTLDLQTKYETDKKEQEIRTLQAEQHVQQLELQQKNVWNAILVSAGALLLLLGALLYRNHRQKQRLQQQRINELETEKKLTATEAVLKGEEQERARLAKDLHDGLSGMLSGAKYSLQSMEGSLIMTADNHLAFQRGMDMLDSSIKEMRRVAQNMMPEALIRFGLDTAINDYCTEINKSGAVTLVYQSIGMENADIPQSDAIAVYRIIQELTNNIIKHSGASQALVQLLHEGSRLVINVEDNGKGFDNPTFERSPGMGWQNIRSRIEYLKGKYEIQSQAGKGASINVEINLSK